MENHRSLLIVAIFSIWVAGCGITDNPMKETGVIEINSSVLDANTTLRYTYKNTTEATLFVILNGSVSNIEKFKAPQWKRLINTLPHRPTLFTYEVQPGEIFERFVDIELIEALTETPAGLYRIALEVTIHPQSPSRETVVSPHFVVK
jgi:hypothetical protein